jgi:uncharacterized protein
MRVPEWLEGKPAVRMNEAPANVEMRRGFAVLRRRWSTGDTVTLELPMEFRTEPIDDLHRDVVAMLRGPLVFVETNPAEKSSKLPHLDALLNAFPDTLLDALRAGHSGAGMFSADLAKRRYAPFYRIGGESYTMYFDRS